VPYDAQMARTRNRVLARGALNPDHGFAFGISKPSLHLEIGFGRLGHEFSLFTSASGVLGVTTLATLVNPLTAGLGLANILLYTMVYTPMKRLSIANTWVGSLVGGIPPLMVCLF